MLGDIDIKKLAEEYEKVMQKRYEFILENDENVNFRFGTRRFWHFLGFHYLTYSVSYKLLIHNHINKDEFYESRGRKMMCYFVNFKIIQRFPSSVLCS